MKCIYIFYMHLYFFLALSCRIYQDAEIIHTQQFTSSNPKSPQTHEKLGELSRNLLDLSASDMVFYVGGYPDDFKVLKFLSFFTSSRTSMISVKIMTLLFECFCSHPLHSAMANIKAASSFPPSTRNSSACTTLKMQSILT